MESAILSPACPLCGQFPALQIGEHQAFCGDEDCKVLVWDPAKTREENFANTRVVDLQLYGDSNAPGPE